MMKKIYLIFLAILFFEINCTNQSEKTIIPNKIFCNSSGNVDYIEIICELEFNDYGQSYSFLVPQKNGLSPLCSDIIVNINDSLINVYLPKNSDIEKKRDSIKTIVIVKYFGIKSIRGWIFDEMYYLLEKNDTLKIYPVLAHSFVNFKIINNKKLCLKLCNGEIDKDNNIHIGYAMSEPNRKDNVFVKEKYHIAYYKNLRFNIIADGVCE